MTFEIVKPLPKKVFRPPDLPIEHEVLVSLEEIFKGAKKKMKITKNICDDQGQVQKNETKELEIDIKPGWKAGTRITFHKEGDVYPGVDPVDVVFIIQDKPHQLFTRDKSNNVYYTMKIDFDKTDCDFEIPTLDGNPIHFGMNGSTIENGFVRKWSNRGLPYPKDPSKRGDFIVKFEIQFKKFPK